MSSSTDTTGTGPEFHPVAFPAAPAQELRIAPVRPRDLRVGEWTRLGPGSGLGDEASERILSEVAEQARTAARAQGYSMGWAQGRREAAKAAEAAAEIEARRHRREENRREEEHLEAIAALRKAAEQLQATVAGICSRIEDQATDVAWGVTEALVGHQVRGADAADVVARVLALAPEGRIARVRLNPDHVGSPALAELESAGIQCIGDPSLDRLDAVIHVEEHAWDLRLGPALQRVREVLS